jgi:oxygen-independent coproporphyrinogen-3 oxidase
MEAVQTGRRPLGRARELSTEERLVRELVLQLKLGEVDAAALGARYDTDVLDRFAGPLRELLAAAWVEIDDGYIRLTRSGLVRADRLLRRFYLPQHQEVRYS